MCKFGLEITPVSSGTTCPEWVAQYDRNIHRNHWIYYLSFADCWYSRYKTNGRALESFRNYSSNL